jgi:two-component system chemotaxis response regulator CheB
MQGHDIITVGASAGGVEALAELVGDLPGDLPASLFVALHVPSHGSSVLPQILSRRGSLPARHAEDGEAIEPGRIYVAPPDNHMLIHEGKVRLSRGPRENGVRPAIDPLFRTASRWFGPRVVGVVLSGTLDDGTAGLMAIRDRGGVTVVQDPDDALFPGMPRNALDVVHVDHVLPVSRLADLLSRLARTAPSGKGVMPMPDEMEAESAIAEFDLGTIEKKTHPGTPSAFGCPDCGGVLWEIQDGEMARFRCRVGHAWSPTSLLSEQSRTLEKALWMAFRALEERAALADRMAGRSRAKGWTGAASRFEGQVKEAKDRAALIRQVLLKNEPAAELPTTPGREDGPG